MSQESEHVDGMKRSVDVDHAPTRTSVVVAILAGVVATLAGGLVSMLALLFGVLGLGLLVAGVTVLESRTAVTGGVGVIFVGVLIGGVLGTPAELLLPAMIATIVAWDVGHNAITTGRQLGRTAPTKRGEVVHVAATVLVGTVAATVAYGVFAVSMGGLTSGAVVFLLLAAIFFAWAIRA